MRALAIAAVAALAPAAAHADQGSTPRLDTQVGGAIGVVGGQMLDEGRTEPDLGVQLGLAATVSYVNPSGLGLVADATWWRGSLVCPTDVACAAHAVHDARMLSGGLRWYPSRAFYLQGLVGAVRTVDDPGFRPAHAWWSGGGSLAIGWRRISRDLFGGFELRGTSWYGEGVAVTSLVAIFSVGRAW